MKLTASMMATLDGVYQGPGGPDEDRRGGFERGGWTAAHADTGPTSNVSDASGIPHPHRDLLRRPGPCGSLSSHLTKPVRLA